MKPKPAPPVEIVYTCPNPPTHAYGVRRWDPVAGRYQYHSQVYTKKDGHKFEWSYSGDKAQTTTGLLSAMFWAQDLANKDKNRWGVEVVIMDEPVVWSTHHSNPGKLAIDYSSDPKFAARIKRLEKLATKQELAAVTYLPPAVNKSCKKSTRK